MPPPSRVASHGAITTRLELTTVMSSPYPARPDVFLLPAPCSLLRTCTSYFLLPISYSLFPTPYSLSRAASDVFMLRGFRRCIHSRQGAHRERGGALSEFRARVRVRVRWIISKQGAPPSVREQLLTDANIARACTFRALTYTSTVTLSVCALVRHGLAQEALSSSS